jgi:hypothetical protein
VEKGHTHTSSTPGHKDTTAVPSKSSPSLTVKYSPPLSRPAREEGGDKLRNGQSHGEEGECSDEFEFKDAIDSDSRLPTFFSVMPSR